MAPVSVRAMLVQSVPEARHGRSVPLILKISQMKKLERDIHIIKRMPMSHGAAAQPLTVSYTGMRKRPRPMKNSLTTLAEYVKPEAESWEKNSLVKRKPCAASEKTAVDKRHERKSFLLFSEKYDDNLLKLKVCSAP